MLIHNADITGSLTINGIPYNTDLFSGSSQVSFTGIADKPTLISGSSQVTYSGLSGIPSGIVSGSSQVTYSGLTGIPSGIVSGSSQVSFTGITNKPTLISGSAQIAALGYATTSTNIFQGNQTITGSLFISQNLVVAGSSSIQYITSSNLDIADNIITVNVLNPSVRFGGLGVIDSGSSPQRSGSLLFDSIKDEWIFVHQNQSTITSSVLIMGPETYNNLGNETYLSANRVPKGSGVEHLRDSNITDTGTVVSINSNTRVTGSLEVTGSLSVNGVTANLSNYVTLNSDQTISGNKTFTGLNRADSEILLKNLVGSPGTASGYTSIRGYSTSGTTKGISFVDPTLNGASLLFDNTANYVYTFPSTTGTVALTSNLSSYLPLTGGTLTGPLTGSSAAFSGAYGSSNGISLSGTTYAIYGANRGATNASAGMNYFNTGSQRWFSGIYENSDNFGIYSVGTSGFPLILNYSTGAATFSSSVTAGGNIQSNITKSGVEVENVNFLQLRLFGTNAIGDSLDIRYLNNNGNNVANISAILGGDNVAYGSLAFSTRNYFTDSMVEVMRINNRGNVGIGTTSPQGLLQIGVNALTNNADASNAFNLKQTSTTAATGIYLERSGERRGYYMYIGGSLDSLTFQRNNAGTKADVMSLTRDGNVGISTDSPNERLQVSGAISATGTATTAFASSSTMDYFSGGTRFISRGGNNSTRGTYTFKLEAANGSLSINPLIITSGGLVGVGIEPSAWDTSVFPDTLQVGNGSISNNGGPFTQFANNIYYDGSNYRYISTGGAQRLIYNTDGTIVFENVASGTGGNTFTFSERMRITPGGHVGIKIVPNSGWGSAMAALQIGTGGVIDNWTGGDSTMSVGVNYYDNGSGSQLRLYAKGASKIGFNENVITFSNVGADSAGSTITWSTRLTVNSDGHVLPGNNGTQNLGSSSLRWATVFTSDLSLSNGIGDYTIVEGEHDLFLYNNKNNKVYKFLVEEVDPSTATPKKS